MSATVAGHSADWDLRGISLIAFAHGASDFYSGLVPLVVYAAVARAGLSPAAQGAIVFTWYFTSSIVQPLFGAYADRRGKWWFLPGSISLTVVAVSIAAASHAIPVLVVCTIVGGLGSAIMHPEAGRYTAQLSGSQKARGVSIFQIGGQIGYACGPLVVAVLLSRFGDRGALYLAIPGALAVAGLFGATRDLAGRASRRTSAPATGGRADRFGIALLVASTALRYLVNAAFMTYLPNLFAAHGDSLVVTGTIVTAFLFVSAIGLYAGGALADRFDPLAITIGSLCASVPFFLAFLLLHGPAALAALMVASILLAMQNAPSVALVQAMLPRNLGMALGLMNGVAFGIGSALVALVGLAVGAFGPSQALVGMSFVPLLAALTYAIAGRRPAGASA